MATDYSRFDQTLGIVKRYRITGTYHHRVRDGYRCLFYKKDEAKRSLFSTVRSEVIGDEYIALTIEGKHEMNAPVPSGALAIENAMNVKLPRDLHDFYARWGGGYLMLSEFHYILSPSEVVSYCTWLRNVRMEDAQLPWRIIRYCDVGEGHFLALYDESGRSDWKVIFASCDFSDEQILDPSFGAISKYGDSFSTWLMETIERDGRFDYSPPGTPWRQGEPLPSERLF